MMSARGRRNKGSNAEREVAAELQAWWRRLEPGCVFHRTPLSGGWASSRVAAGYNASGDVVTTALRFPWTVEVKRNEGFAWKNVVAGKASPVWEWWGQAQRQAREVDKVPMLWLRRSREPWRVMVPAGSLVWVYPGKTVPEPLTVGFHRSNYRWSRWPARRGVRPVCLLADVLLGERPILFASATVSDEGDGS